MIEKVHDHIVEELKVNARTDTVFVLTAIGLNLATLGTNTAIAASDVRGTTVVIMALFVALIFVVNLVAEIGLIKGRQMRTRLLEGLMRMYADHGVDGYYDSVMPATYRTRYNLFMTCVLTTGILALVIPFLVI